MSAETNGAKPERSVQAGPITLLVDPHEGLVILTLVNQNGDRIELPMTSQEATRLGKYLITQGMLTDV